VSHKKGTFLFWQQLWQMWTNINYSSFYYYILRLTAVKSGIKSSTLPCLKYVAALSYSRICEIIDWLNWLIIILEYFVIDVRYVWTVCWLAWSLQCYSCRDDHWNWGECTEKIEQCAPFQDACVSYAQYTRMFITYLFY